MVEQSFKHPLSEVISVAQQAVHRDGSTLTLGVVGDTSSSFLFRLL